MARVGEGDPRWLVQDRVDGTNVNNWHWTEKDCTPWAKSRLSQFFEKQVIFENEESKVETTTFEELNAEVSINTRKGKIFYFFEIDFKLKWEATQKKETDKKKVFKGTINLPGLSEENEDDVEVTVSREGGTKIEENFRKQIEKTYVPYIKEKLALLLKELRQDQTPKLKTSSTNVVDKSLSSNNDSSPTVVQTNSSVKTTSITLQTEFNAPPHIIFQNLLDQGCVSAFTHSSCTIENKKGGSFSLLNGTIRGEILEIQGTEKVVQKWRFNDWKPEIYSTVTMKFKPSGIGRCTLDLEQKNIPVEDKERVRNGWEEFFFNRLRVMMGYGGMTL